jgi:NitT/TauT family transport system ATP-binding protein
MQNQNEDRRPTVAVEIHGLCKKYGEPDAAPENAITVLDALDLDVHDGEFVTIFGPNGCGKSTLLKILAGLVPYEDGIVQINGAAPGDAKVGFVFQSFEATLFPWRRNLDNVAFPLELAGRGRQERRGIAREFMRQMSISLPEDGYPYRLSGGQQQLLSISRALIAEPTVLLMDEPFNQLDYQTRMNMHIKTLELWQRTGTTVMFVSHDIDEALLLGDRTVLLSKRPAHVVEILTNTLPRPRDHEMLKSTEFFNLRSKALEVFKRALAE